MAKDNEQLLKNPSLASEPCFKQLATSEQTLAVQRKKEAPQSHENCRSEFCSERKLMWTSER